MNYYTEYEEDENEKKVREQHPAWVAREQELGCAFCYDSRTKKEIEIYFFDRANNMRLATFCPSCGRKFQEVN